MIVIFVPDTPRPGGSKSVFLNRKTGKVNVAPASKHTKTWRNSVMAFARQKYKGKPLAGPIQVRYTFFMARPKVHFGTGKNKGVLKPSAPKWHSNKPDLTKLIRSTEDALTGITWKDDSQVCHRKDCKIYANYPEQEGVEITILPLEGDIHRRANET